MKKNIGTKDRLLRLSLAIIAGVAILFVESMALRAILGIISLFTFYEALVGWCVLYAILGKNTCPVNLDK